MKLLVASLLAAMTMNAFADVTTCLGNKDGKDVTFTVIKDESLVVKSVSVSVNGSLVAQELTQVRSAEIAGGTMITAGAPNSIAINEVSIFVDADRGCRFTHGDESKSCYLGWVNLYPQDLVIRGINLKCE